MVARLVPVTLEPATSSGRTIVVAGEGLRTADTLPGDLRVNVAIRCSGYTSDKEDFVQCSGSLDYDYLL